MVAPEVLNQLTLISAQRVRGHEAQNTTCLNKVENVNLARKPVFSLLVDIHSFLSSYETWSVLEPTNAAAKTKEISAYVVHVREFKRFAAHYNLFEFLLVVFI